MKLHRELTVDERTQLGGALARTAEAGNRIAVSIALFNQLSGTYSQALREAIAAREKTTGEDAAAVVTLIAVERRCELLEQTCKGAEDKIEKRCDEGRDAVYQLFSFIKGFDHEMVTAKIDELEELFRPYYYSPQMANSTAAQTDTVADIHLFFKARFPFDRPGAEWNLDIVTSTIARWTGIANKILQGEDFIPDIKHEEKQSAAA